METDKNGLILSAFKKVLLQRGGDSTAKLIPNGLAWKFNQRILGIVGAQLTRIYFFYRWG